jgi:hypothetical protein
MNNIIKLLIVFFITPGNADWFGREAPAVPDYNECILTNMQGVASDVAATQIKLACREITRKCEEIIRGIVNLL